MNAKRKIANLLKEDVYYAYENHFLIPFDNDDEVDFDDVYIIKILNRSILNEEPLIMYKILWDDPATVYSCGLTEFLLKSHPAFDGHDYVPLNDDYETGKYDYWLN